MQKSQEDLSRYLKSTFPQDVVIVLKDSSRKAKFLDC